MTNRPERFYTGVAVWKGVTNVKARLIRKEVWIDEEFYHEFMAKVEEYGLNSFQDAVRQLVSQILKKPHPPIDKGGRPPKDKTKRRV